VHIPILVRPIVEGLVEPFERPEFSAIKHYLVDCTFGRGGHTAAFLEAFASKTSLKHHCVLAVDQDPAAIEAGRTRFKKEMEEGRLELYQCRFGETSNLLKGKPILGLMADLGFSSDQVDNPERGLSFQSTGPLDMRLDPTRGLSCRELIAKISEAELEKILREYGEERFSRRIAASIIARRREGVVPGTTQQLVDIVIRAIPLDARHGRIHAATRTFQALRIAVNEELAELDRLLDEIILNVKIGGRVAILSFHSLEDRKVKLKFREKLKNELGQNRTDTPVFLSLTKKPLQADPEEIQSNPRARSAKLRIAERVYLE
jgi:16S rRNA (cytosine1402-N4)-methyltransferase